MSITYIIPTPSMSRPNTRYDDDYDKHIVGTVPKSSRKFVERGKIDTLNKSWMQRNQRDEPF